jgi:tetratricopeptide (TPR) repeat protein
MDLRGLAALAGRILRTLANFETSGDDQAPLELYAISRLLNRRGERSKARRACERSLGGGLPEPIARRASHELARLAKRQLDFGRAFELWNQLADSSEPSFEALEQLAIHYERRERNYSEAVRVSRLALAELRRASRLGIVSHRDDRVSARLKRRLIRLETKARQTAASLKLK